MQIKKLLSDKSTRAVKIVQRFHLVRRAHTRNSQIHIMMRKLASSHNCLDDFDGVITGTIEAFQTGRIVQFKNSTVSGIAWIPESVERIKYCRAVAILN